MCWKGSLSASPQGHPKDQSRRSYSKEKNNTLRWTPASRWSIGPMKASSTARGRKMRWRRPAVIGSNGMAMMRVGHMMLAVIRNRVFRRKLQLRVKRLRADSLLHSFLITPPSQTIIYYGWMYICCNFVIATACNYCTSAVSIIFESKFHNGRRAIAKDLLGIANHGARGTPQHPQALLQSSHQGKPRQHRFFLGQVLSQFARPAEQQGQGPHREARFPSLSHHWFASFTFIKTIIITRFE